MAKTPPRKVCRSGVRGSFHLPSGVVAELYEEGAPMHAEGLFRQDAAKLRGVLLRPDGTETTLDALPLSDFHTLRAILRRLGAIEELPFPAECRNCGHRWAVRPCGTLELAPYRDGELDDPELDAPFDFTVPHPFPELPAEVARLQELHLDPRTVGEAQPLHRALVAPGPLRFDARIVQSMGVRALGGEGEPARIAALLNTLPDEVFYAAAAAFERAHYPARLSTPHCCPDCGVMAWVEAPAHREFSVEAGDPAGVDLPPLASTTHSGFPGIDDFEAIVRRIAPRVYDELGVRNVGLVIETGIANCDDGGCPLLGSYLPEDPTALPPQGAEVTLFYRTFQSMWEEEGPCDLETEVEETLRHELQHHLSFLSGHDPVDDEERRQIAEEYARRVGRGEVRRRAVRAAFRSVREFAMQTWWLWLLVLVMTWVGLAAR